MTNTIRLTTETHKDIGVHITYATTRPTKHTWNTIELDRHTIGEYTPDTTHERASIHAATLKHYTTTDGTKCDTTTDTTTHTTIATPTTTTSALIAMKRQATTTNPTITRGQTIINQIKADRARRHKDITALKGRRAGLLTDKTRSIFA